MIITLSKLIMLPSEARWYTNLTAYLSILSGAILLLISFVGYSQFDDEKTMSTVIFIIIAFVEILGGILIIGVWQPQKVKIKLKLSYLLLLLLKLMLFNYLSRIN